MSEKFSNGTKISKQTNKQTNKSRHNMIEERTLGVKVPV